MNFPEYLKSNLLINNYTYNNHVAKADLQCKCGCLNFKVLYPGSTVNINGKTYACAFQTNTDSFFLIKIECAECQNVYLLFDADLHGWDGFYCHDSKQAALERPPLTPWTCLSCGHKFHKVSMKIDHTDRNEFEEIQQRKNKSFVESEWLLSFEWIWIGITCCNCGFKNSDWVDYETA